MNTREHECHTARCRGHNHAGSFGKTKLVGHVEYYDPLQVSVLKVDVVSWKHFRYAYQKEARIAWLPPAPVDSLDPLDVTHGSLEDICELVKPLSVAT